MPRDIAELKSETRAAGLPYVNPDDPGISRRSEEHTSELQSRRTLVCRPLLEKKKNQTAM